MKATSDEFKKLQKDWYQRLKENGFKDIEKDERLNEPVETLFRNTDEFLMPLQEEYYRLLSQAVNDENTVFKNEADRYILTKYSEGMQIKDIVEDLSKLGMPRKRLAIRYIIRRYEMKWKIKTYSKKQLNQK